MNKGKIFERQIKLSAERQNLFILRLNDTDLSWAKSEKSKFSAKSPCDFILYNYPNIFFLELKSTENKSISIQRELEDKNHKMIKLHQINSLVQMSQCNGAYAGFIFNFKERDGILEDTYYMSIQDFSNFLVNTDKMSINKLDIVQNNGIILEQKIMRKYYIYNLDKLIKEIVKKG